MQLTNVTKSFFLKLMRKIIIAIDGYSACGKSTTAKALAKKLEYSFIDSGAMYRAVTLYFQQNHVSITNRKKVEETLSKIDIDFRYNGQLERNEVVLNGVCVEDEIRTLGVTKQVSEVSAISPVRHKLVALQRKMGKSKGIVMDGRDIGTNVFPEAELKIFMDADSEIRIERRQKELLAKGDLVSYQDVKDSIEKRDLIDTTRKENPLRKAEDAWTLDNSELTMEEQVEVVMRWVDEKLLAIEMKTSAQ